MMNNRVLRDIKTIMESQEDSVQKVMQPEAWNQHFLQHQVLWGFGLEEDDFFVLRAGYLPLGL